MLDPEEAKVSRAAIDALGDEIALTACRLDAAQQVLLTHIRAFDQAGGWAWQGAKTCAAWLSWRIGCGRNAANERVRVANALGGLPLIDAAFGTGELSYCKVRAMTRVATPANEALLLDQARSATGAELERICASVRQVLRPRDAPGDDEVRYVRRRHTGLGMTRIEAQLYADEAERVWQALAAVRRELESATGPLGRMPGSHAEAPGARAEGSRASQLAVASPADEGVGPDALGLANASMDEFLAPAEDAEDEPFAPIVIEGHTYGENSTDLQAVRWSSSFRGNSVAVVATPCAPEPSAGSTAPRHGKDLASPGLADALVAVAEVALVRGISSRPRPAAERRQLLVHLTEDRLAEFAGSTGEAVASSASVPARAGEASAPRGIAECGCVASSARGASGEGVAVVGELHHGVRLCGQTPLRIACDAGLVVAKTSAHGDVLDIGRRSRTVSPSLLRALWVRDRGCRFPGCTQVAFVEAHHLEHWVRGGATPLANIALLCHHHHMCVHEGGFRMERDAHGALAFANREGRPIPEAPEPPSLDEPVFAAFTRAAQQLGIAFTETTSLIRRDFRRSDLRGAANAVIARTLPAQA